LAPHISPFSLAIEADMKEQTAPIATIQSGVYMLGGQKFWALVLCACFVFIATVPAMAADPQVTAKDLKGISPQRHRFWFATVGGAAIGAGIGVLVGSGGDIAKGIFVGGGAGSALYLHSHKRDNLSGYRNWAYIGSYTALGGGLGWTLCGCGDGFVAGALIGGGATTAWLVTHPQRTPPTATGPHP
jgi:hypothetical protein